MPVARTTILDGLDVDAFAQTAHDRLVLQAVRIVTKWSTLVPVFYGVSSAGKTFFAERLAAAIGAEFIHLLLQQSKPDDVAGCQVITLEGELTVELPWWFKRARAAAAAGRPVVIFLDELNLARDEVKAAVMTFMRERKLYDAQLTGDVLVLGACNPGAFEEAFRRRCVFIPWPMDQERLAVVAGESALAQAFLRLSGEEINAANSAVKYRPPAPEFSAVPVALLAAAEADILGLDRQERAYVLRLLMPEEKADALLKELARGARSLDAFLEDPERLADQVARLPAVDAVALLSGLIAEAHACGREDAVVLFAATAHFGILRTEDEIVRAEKYQRYLLALDEQVRERVRTAVSRLGQAEARRIVEEAGLIAWPGAAQGADPEGAIVDALRAATASPAGAAAQAALL